MIRKIGSGDSGDPLAVALTLEILGGEIKDVSERAAQLVREWEAAMQSYSEAAMFVDHQPSWLLAVVTLLREVSGIPADPDARAGR